MSIASRAVVSAAGLKSRPILPAAPQVISKCGAALLLRQVRPLLLSHIPALQGQTRLSPRNSAWAVPTVPGRSILAVHQPPRVVLRPSTIQALRRLTRASYILVTPMAVA